MAEETKAGEPLPMEVDGDGAAPSEAKGGDASSSKAGNGEDSDVELSGIEESEGEDDDADAKDDSSDPRSSPVPTAAAGAAAAAGGGGEVHDYDEVVKDHEERLHQLRLQAESKGRPTQGLDPQARIQYLMQQSEVFTNFLESTDFGNKKDTGAAKGKGKKGGGGGRTRMQEEEEDKLMMKSALSKARVTRVLQQPSIIRHGTMRSYQLEGLNWMIKLHDNGINGILADEMGLGKTLQSISLLAYLREARGINGPHIVIVPKSTVGNWLREFGRWCPTIKAVRLLGNRDERTAVVHNVIEPRAFDVIVTSYECMLKEQQHLRKVQWRYLMIDEAHRIKNENSSLSKVVRTMSTQFRLLITGTPLQNNLHELWALLNFLLPDVFSSADDFDKWFNVGDEDARDNVIKKLHTVLRPFMLRRVKADVEKDLPPKKEIKLYIGMTKLQKEVYKRILDKDSTAFNMLGGPDRVRLLNVLMQLRKACNHPYLFDGTEPGPPFTNGPHLWENAGKMVLLNKLLPKLRAQGSRVLIFSQMTRLLDILEDYMHIQGYDYCRIDGSTDGEKRDSEMNVFNEPGSPKFCFLLSTRAGGLGINLQTADTVVLYDSDWNPQVDLQAMDRAHRIGQTKPVRVFRFITEGAVEEKIVERADRKLFLDAAVIQQGRMAEKHAQLSKNELMTMVTFGADAIMRADASEELTDEDIDVLLARGEEKTAAQNAKYQTETQHNLANFTLLGDENEANLFMFDGQDHRGQRGSDGLLLPLSQRKRKTVAETWGDGRRAGDKAPAAPKRKKGMTMHDFQFFNKARLEQIQDREHELAERKASAAVLLKELRQRARQAKNGDGEAAAEAEVAEVEREMAELELTDAEVREKQRLVAEGFGSWMRKDFRAFIGAMERNGREDLETICKEVCLETGKTEEAVTRYYKVFWRRFQEIGDADKYIDKIERGEKRIRRSREIREALERKVARHRSPWQNLTINYTGQKGKIFTEEEDAFLVHMMHRYGYGNWEVIRIEIRKAWQFRFDWFFKSRNAGELQKRGDVLIKFIERENEEYGAVDGGGGGGGSGGGKKRKSHGGAAAAGSAAVVGSGGTGAAPGAGKRRKK